MIPSSGFVACGHFFGLVACGHQPRSFFLLPPDAQTSPPPLLRKSKVQKPGRDGSHRAATQPPRGTHGNLPRLVWKKAALASGVRRSRLASALSTLSLTQRPRPPARGASPLMWPDPPSTAAVLLSVRLGRHRATGADPATASRQTDPIWQPPQATTNQPPPTTSA
jgi:hypothetical protein